MYKKFYTTSMCPQRRMIEKRFKNIRSLKNMKKSMLIIGIFTAVIIFSASVLAGGVFRKNINIDVRNYSMALNTDNVSGDKINVLLNCVDNSGVRADALMLISADKAEKRIFALSVPRDTFVEEGDSITKISNLMFGEKDEQRIVDAVRLQLGIPVNYYASIDLKIFNDVIDMLGGVKVDIKSDMKYEDPYQNLYIDLKKGSQLVDGDKAEQLLRFRKGEGGYEQGDITRIGVQLEFFKALAEQKLTPENAANVGRIFAEIAGNISTNYPTERLIEDISSFSGIDIENIETAILPGGLMTKEDGYFGFEPDTEKLSQLIQSRLK